MADLRRLADVSVGEWLVQRLDRRPDAWGTAGSVVPTGFARVVRVLHPVGEGGATWASVAARTGRTMHPLVQWRSIADHAVDGRSSDIDPEEGSIPAETLEAVLRHCPADGEVVHAVWDGFGGVDPATPLLPGHGRCYALFAGPRAAVTDWPGLDTPWHQSANLVWPADRSWCVATEIDWDFTLVACADGVADALRAEPDLETYDVAVTDDLTWAGDRLNGPARA
ncbi:hypothetical protein G7075_01935 [Phycicoccus sp. HDW14]|uniref:hypothetical protein n=1 Tax=Phycicoccus sp. HDW14 TaxID=2714941 RepID=UPI00140A24A9|nr:hypothetical protein [Phycicoccus sp. HDW14]QIM20196.1 hypothetical protein G7075_01935 [Phycicoccus sp. HDW14]